MGTRWSAQVVAGAVGLAGQIERVLARVIDEMSHWERDSALSRFNRSEPGWWQPLPSGFAQVLAAARDIAAASEGAFDPAVGALVDVWGFGPSGPRAGLPDAAEIAALHAQSGIAQIEQDGPRARRLAPARLDFSGIAKGFAVDAVAERLLALGHRDFLVEIGGELRGEGIRPDGQPWWVDLEPVPGCPTAPLRIALHGLSVATSGDYRRGFAHGGQHYAHTIDPRTGRPIDHGVASVSVLHRSCMIADAWATALTVLGPAGMAIAQREGLAAQMIVRGVPAAEHVSPALAEML